MTERILLVDDDAGVRDVVAFPLRREGYEVDEERDGPAALEAGRTGGYSAGASIGWRFSLSIALV